MGYHTQTRDRTIDEAVDAAINESQGGWSLMGGHGGAAAATFPIAGVPVHFGGTLAIGGGISKSWGHRDLTADSGQELHDSIIQTTNVFRSLNSTVVVQATQEESNYLETRTITNHNHCHALTIQFYEVLRHFKVVTEYVTSRRVVLVPFKLLTFNAEIALRYRTILEAVLLDPKLVSCFAAIVRLHYCPALYGTTAVVNDSGDQTTPPSGTTPLYRVAGNDHFYTTSKAERDGAIANFGYTDEGIACYVFEAQVVPQSQSQTPTNTDYEVSKIRYRIKRGRWGTESKPNGKKTSVRLRLKKKDNTYIIFTINGGLQTSKLEVYDTEIENDIGLTEQKWLTWHEVTLALPVMRSQLSAVETEWTPHWSTTIPNWSFRGLDLRTFSPQGEKILFFGEDASDFVADADDWSRPKTWQGQLVAFSPTSGSVPSTQHSEPSKTILSRETDECCEKQLVSHLNTNIGFYNRAIWLLQDPSERVMMLNMALAGYSDILENMDTTPTAVSGNYVAFPYNAELSKDEEEKEKNRLAANPLSESLVSVPTRGVFAETHLSHCSACEVRDVTRFWQWDESPCEKPPAIEGITPGPRGQAPTIQPTALPSPVVQIMQPLAAPDPVGLAAALNLLGQANIFRDMSGMKELQELLSGLASGAVDLVKGQQQLEALKAKQEKANGAQKSGGGGGGSFQQQTPQDRYDNLQVAKEVAKAAQSLGWDKDKTSDVTSDIVSGGGFLSSVRKMVEQEILGAAGNQQGITSSSLTPCVNENVTFTLTGASGVASINWSGGDNPSTGVGPTFTTRFSTHGEKTVKALWTTDAGTISATASVTVKELSGAQWVAQFPPSTSTADLTPTFRTNVDNFITALNTAGATVDINQTYRPAGREYLMHYSYRIAREGLPPSSVPAQAGVAICWQHRDINGNPDSAASTLAAEQMVTGYQIVHRPALPSHHGLGRAIDMDISWTGNLTITDGNGQQVTITSTPHTGAGNIDLQAVGASYHVMKLVGDAPHWSDDGH